MTKPKPVDVPFTPGGAAVFGYDPKQHGGEAVTPGSAPATPTLEPTPAVAPAPTATPAPSEQPPEPTAVADTPPADDQAASPDAAPPAPTPASVTPAEQPAAAPAEAAAAPAAAAAAAIPPSPAAGGAGTASTVDATKAVAGAVVQPELEHKSFGEHVDDWLKYIMPMHYKLLQTVAPYVGPVAKDVGGGIIEAVPQAIAGKLDFYRNTLQAVTDLGQFIDEKFQLPKTPTIDGKEAPGLASAIPTFGLSQPETYTGSFIRQASAFGKGFNIFKGLLDTVGWKGFGAASAAGGLGTFFSADPNSPNLANYLAKWPALQDSVVSYLATDPNDPAAINRVKNAALGVAEGAVAEGITKAITTYGAWRQAKVAEAAATPEAQAAVQQAADRQARQAQDLVAGVHEGEPPVPAMTAAVPDTAAPAPTAAETAIAQAEAKGPGMPGEPTVPRAVINLPKDVTAADVQGAIKRQVNWLQVGDDDLLSWAKAVGEADPSIHGKVVTNEMLQKQMADLGLTVKDVLNRDANGNFASAAEAAGFIKLFNAGHERLKELAHLAESPNATMTDRYKFSQAFTVQMAMYNKLVPGSSEAGRTLNVLRQASTKGPAFYGAVIKDFSEMGYPGSTQKLAEMVVDLEKQGVPAGGVQAALQKSWGKWWSDGFKESYALSLLWGPKTHIRNTVGNFAMALEHSLDRDMAAKFSFISGTPVDQAIMQNEGWLYARGQLRAFKDAAVLAGKSLRTGEREFATQYGTANTATDTSKIADVGTGVNPATGVREPSITASSFAMSNLDKNAAEAAAFAATPMGKAIDYFGQGVRLPGRALSAADDFFKVLGFSGMREVEAHRRALGMGLTGKDYTDKVADLIVHTPDDITLKSINHADYMTYNDKAGALADFVMAGRNAPGLVGPMVTVVSPYVRTPANIFRWSFEHIPVLNMVSRQWRQDFAAGGQRRDLALGKVAAGGAILSVMFDYAKQGLISGSGPIEPAARDALKGTGWQPFSVKVPGGWVSINNMGAIAPLLTLVGGVTEHMSRYDHHPEKYDNAEELAAAATGTVAASMLNQSFATGVTKFMSALENTMRGDNGALMRFAQDTAVSAVPFSSAIRSVRTAVDPTPRETSGMWDALLKQVPGLQDNAIPHRDITGSVMKTDVPFGGGVAGKLYNLISPFSITYDTKDPLFHEMVDLHDRSGVTAGIQRIGWNSSFMGVPTNFKEHPEVLDYYRRLAGNELKWHPTGGTPVGKADFLRNVITGKDPQFSPRYNDMSDADKADFLHKIESKYRAAAQVQIMSEAPWRFPDFYKMIGDTRRQKAVDRMPVSAVQAMRSTGQEPIVKQKEIAPIQTPLPDRFGRPAVVPPVQEQEPALLPQSPKRAPLAPRGGRAAAPPGATQPTGFTAR